MTAGSNYESSPVSLLHTERDEAVDAELWDAITDKNLADWEAEWIPELFKIIQTLHRQGVERQLWPQSRHWNWREKLKAIEAQLANQSFSVVCDGMTQAMMITDQTRRAKIASQKDDHLVYVEFLEAAPWNRKELHGQQPRYKGSGSILVHAAIALSKMEGFKGRIGLHSLPQSNDFYANSCGMTDLGQDATYQNLRYFEMTPEQANAFDEKG